MAMEGYENWEAPYTLHQVPLLQNPNAFLQIIICYKQHISKNSCDPGADKMTKWCSCVGVALLFEGMALWW
jgi:hypothetical protein